MIHSNALRSDLQHPNEYVRGVTLRFVCKLTEPELLEPLIPVVRQCLVPNNISCTLHNLLAWLGRSTIMHMYVVMPYLRFGLFSCINQP